MSCKAALLHLSAEPMPHLEIFAFAAGQDAVSSNCHGVTEILNDSNSNTPDSVITMDWPQWTGPAAPLRRTNFKVRVRRHESNEFHFMFSSWLQLVSKKTEQRSGAQLHPWQSTAVHNARTESSFAHTTRSPVLSQSEAQRSAAAESEKYMGKGGYWTKEQNEYKTTQKRPLRTRETSWSLRGHYAVTTVTTRLLRSLRGHEDTTRSKRAIVRG